MSDEYTQEASFLRQRAASHLRKRAEKAESEVVSLKARLFEMQQAAKDAAKRTEKAEAEVERLTKFIGGLRELKEIFRRASALIDAAQESKP